MVAVALAGAVKARLAALSPRDRLKAMAALERLGARRIEKAPDVVDDASMSRSAAAQRARTSLRAFVETAWPIIEPDVPFVSNWHIDELCLLLECVTRGDLDRVLINVSPGSAKSLIVSVFWAAWEWIDHPALRTLAASYAASLSIRDNLRLRDLVTSEWYQAHYPLRLKPDQNEKGRFDTTAGGWRIGTSVGGAGTGHHPDRIIIDDPHSADQARSAVERLSACDWFDRTISTRGVARGARIVVIMQRLHEDDLSGHLLARGGWTHVMWPMRFDPERADPRDPRKEAGELFWPALFNEAKVARLELDLDAYGTAGQLQQQPAPEGGGLFQRDWFTTIEEDALPKDIPFTETRAYDIAATKIVPGGKKKKADWTVGARVRLYQNGIFVIMDIVRGQWSPAEVDRVMHETARMDGRSCRVREEKEPGSSGVAVIEARRRMMAGFDYEGVPATGDKATRAGPTRSQAQGGNVRLLRAPWNAAYISEACIFPNGSHDDQVDAVSTAVNDLTTAPKPLTAIEASWG